ncbi:MAG: hypothetical protein HPAVJP_1310 [Candidatus Hepatoplasma vulgare]|nr:MAG: hypothetical protein HPAVJP_1310 [Candidatus Hepatoplasma sp.]
MNKKINKIPELIEKYDQYKNLLTEKQRNVFEKYYFKDYSMQEIAEMLNITKPAVNDLLKRTEKILKKYYEKLKENKD